jgi:hypothetical protein
VEGLKEGSDGKTKEEEVNLCSQTSQGRSGEVPAYHPIKARTQTLATTIGLRKT